MKRFLTNDEYFENIKNGEFGDYEITEEV